MRNKKKEITDINVINNILNQANICRIALSHDNKPYIVPVNFAYKDNTIYIHSAKNGQKIEMIQKNNVVCFEVDIESEVLLTSNPCDCTTKYQSVIGYGKALLIDDKGKKQEALDIIVNKYYKKTDGKSFEYRDNCLNRTRIIKIEIESMSGKKSG